MSTAPRDGTPRCDRAEAERAMSRRRSAPRRVEVTVSDLDDAMRGRAWLDGRELLIANALPEETLTVEIIARRRGRWFGRPLSWRQMSPRRRSAPCPVFGLCGGCAAQHLEPGEQLERKRQDLLERLAAAGVRPRELPAPVTGPRLRYRRRARLAVRYLPRKDELLVGFREAFDNKVVRIETCPVLAPPFAELIAPLKHLIAGLSIKAAVPQLELAAGDRGASAVLRHLQAPTVADRTRLERFQDRYGVEILLQSGGYDSIATLEGTSPHRLSYRLDPFGINLAFDPVDFVQVNARMNVELVRAALSGLALQAGDRVLDLFCGIGNFALPVARHGVHVTGMDVSDSLIARARENASANGLNERAAFRAVDLYEEHAAQAAWNGLGSVNKVILDPPRSGAGATLAMMSRAPMERIIYVSCYPQSFVEDAAALRAAGYDCLRVGVFDMFPHTAHMETLGVFQRF